MAEVAARAVRRGGRWTLPTAYLFGAGFVLASTLAAIAVSLSTMAPGAGTFEPPSTEVVNTVLWVNLGLVLALGAVVVARIIKLLASRDQDAGVKLHLRFVTLFAAAAALPAVGVALFFGVLVNQSVENWFSQRVNSLVENSATIYREYGKQLTSEIEQRGRQMAEVLNRDAGLQATDPAAFNQTLASQTEFRDFTAAYVIDRTGRVAARFEQPGSPSYAPPATEAIAVADGGDAGADPDEAADTLRVLLKLDGFADAYLYYVVVFEPGSLSTMFGAEDAVQAYREVRQNRDRLQSTFRLAYIQTALLVLIGAVWVGMSAAASISTPVARLVAAADKAAGGDLSARVVTGSGPPEIEVLSHAFNRMTGDLQTQQAALRAASLDAESRRQFIETVLAGVSAGVIGLNSAGRISAANSQALHLLGLKEGAIHGRLLAEAAPELASVAEAAGQGSEAETEVDIIRAHETRRLRVRASPVAEGGLVLTFDDITRLVAAQRNAAWRDVARRIAHEIKNPLTPIQLSAERLRRKYRSQVGPDLETFDRCTDTIIRQVGDIGRMVDEFSAFARMPAPRFGRCDAAELLRQAVFDRRVADPDIVVELVEPTPAVLMVCDQRMVGQALLNILKNAAEAVAARRLSGSTVQGRVTARLVADDETVAFEIADNGVGLPLKDRDRLTEPYVTTREKGTGLGLAIVKRIIEDHGGQLDLQDGPDGEGARVVLTFPRGQTAQVEQQSSVNA